MDILKSATVKLGKLIRRFQLKTCVVYDTKELPREATARLRKAKKPHLRKTDKSNGTNTTDKTGGSVASALASSASPSHTGTETTKEKKVASKRVKHFNLKAYKDHSLGDYVESIRRNGTVDSYSTESVSYIFMFAYPLPVLTLS